jgi:uncharacterized damage-inducible protein DinB
MRALVICAIAVMGASACATPAPVPAPPSTAVRDSLVGAFGIARNYITQAAEQVPDALYSYQPTIEVRTLGALFAHVSNANYLICGTATGDAAPEGATIEETTIQAALAESFAFCERAFDTLNDTTGGEAVKLFDRIDSTRLGALAFNTAHLMEHYGNIVTYMRLNKLVPPSSQG